MRHAIGWGIVLPVTLVLGSGCATREWVDGVVARRDAETSQRLSERLDRVESQVAQGTERSGQIEARVGRIDGRVAGVEGRVAAEGQRIDAVSGQVRDIEASMGQVDRRARGAQERADTAMARAGTVDTRLGRLWSNRYESRVVEALNVYFPYAQADLGDGAQTELLRVVRELEAHPTLTVELHGFTDPSGARDLNYQLSQRRIEAVRRFLARKGVSLGRIQSVVQGPISDPGVPPDKKRRVTVKLLVDQD
jgi:outer membrane protein OmpA-like peptidoglycan-associated protein